MANKNNIGKTKRSTDNMIDDAIARQNDWQENRRLNARRFFKRLNVFARPKEKPVTQKQTKTEKKEIKQNHNNRLRSYWFPIVCAIIVIIIAILVMFIKTTAPQRVVIVPVIPDTTTTAVTTESKAPSFDIVRVTPNGGIVVAGRWAANKNVSVMINNKIVATERTDKNGEFVYAPKKVLDAGNYTLSLIGADTNTKSVDKVFLYVSEQGYENSVSLLMTPNGSNVLRASSFTDNEDLAVSKIDYMNSGRITVSGTAMPRMHVSLWLGDTQLGLVRVSDNRHYDVGANVGILQPGRKYVLDIRMHDENNRVIANKKYTFTMPKPTGNDDTYYTVRRGDYLWIIARNLKSKGTLFTIITSKKSDSVLSK